MSGAASRTVIFAHESGVVRRACACLLEETGAAVVLCSGIEELHAALGELPQSNLRCALALDASLAGAALESIIGFARSRNVARVIIVATVYGRGAYKRAPKQLYGADAWIEVHRLGAELLGQLGEVRDASEGGAIVFEATSGHPGLRSDGASVAPLEGNGSAASETLLQRDAARLILEHADRYADLTRHDDALHRTLLVAQSAGTRATALQEAVRSIVDHGLRDDASRAGTSQVKAPSLRAPGTGTGGAR